MDYFVRRILLAVFLVLAMPTAAFARLPVPGDACGGAGADANGYSQGVTNAWQMTGKASDGGIVNGMFCNGSTWTGVINFQSTGNVGIGTTTPTNNLVVYTTTPGGGISTDGDSNGFDLRLYNVGKGDFAVVSSAQDYSLISQTGDVVLRTDPGAGNLIVANEDGSNIIFSTGIYSNNDTEKMRITNAGNIGIGKTSPTAKLDTKLHSYEEFTKLCQHILAQRLSVWQLV